MWLKTLPEDLSFAPIKKKPGKEVNRLLYT